MGIILVIDFDSLIKKNKDLIRMWNNFNLIFNLSKDD
jgi:hypothetical protein